MRPLPSLSVQQPTQELLFVAEVPAPTAGELVPEAVLYAFELAHDLLERDHPQMRASLLWFGDIVFAAVQLNFICVMPGGDVRVEFFVGRELLPSRRTPSSAGSSTPRLTRASLSHRCRSGGSRSGS